MIYIISILIITFFVVTFFLSLVNAPKRVVTGPTNTVMAIKPTEKEKTSSSNSEARPSLITLMFETGDCSCPFYNIEYIIMLPENVSGLQITKKIKEIQQKINADDLTYEENAEEIMEAINYKIKPFKYGKKNIIEHHYFVML